MKKWVCSILKPSFYCQGDMISLAKRIHFIVLSFFPQPYCYACFTNILSSFFVFAMPILFKKLYCCLFHHYFMVFLFFFFLKSHIDVATYFINIYISFFSLNVNDDTSTQGHKSRHCLHVTGYMISQYWHIL